MGYVLTVLERVLLTIGAQGRPQLSDIGGGGGVGQEFKFNPPDFFENLLLKGGQDPFDPPP